jgi:hypothetical protein
MAPPACLGSLALALSPGEAACATFESKKKQEGPRGDQSVSRTAMPPGMAPQQGSKRAEVDTSATSTAKIIWEEVGGGEMRLCDRAKNGSLPSPAARRERRAQCGFQQRLQERRQGEVVEEASQAGSV